MGYTTGTSAQVTDPRREWPQHLQSAVQQASLVTSFISMQKMLLQTASTYDLWRFRSKSWVFTGFYLANTRWLLTVLVFLAWQKQ